jgi:hypothetical protein
VPDHKIHATEARGAEMAIIPPIEVGKHPFNDAIKP